jgi:hypothetical protein
MKVKSSLVGTKKTTDKIDWDNPQLLRFKPDKNPFIVLSNGINDDYGFQGVVLIGSVNYHIGYFNKEWVKENFEPIPTNQQVILQNSND